MQPRHFAALQAGGSQASRPGAVAVCTAEWAGDWAGPPAGRGGDHREDIRLERKRPAAFGAFKYRVDAVCMAETMIVSRDY
jgi:hypothetical protein